MSTASTLIQCLLRRVGGSIVECAGKTYHFKPETDAADAPHTCAVPNADTEALHFFRRTREAYLILGDESNLPAAPKEPVGQTIHADKAAATEPAPAASEPDPAAPVMLTSPEGEQINLSAMSRAELVAFAKDNFGIKIHHNSSDETAIQKIVEAARGE